MKRFILIVALLSFANCASKMPASYTPETKRIYILTDVVNGIGALQTAAENAVPSNILSLASARKVVQFCVLANTTIGQTPNGWYATISAAYIQVKSQLTPSELTKFAVALTAFEIVLTSFSG